MPEGVLASIFFPCVRGCSCFFYRVSGKETIKYQGAVVFMSAGIKLLMDLGPLAAFFVGYKLGGVQLATVLIMGCTTLSLGVTYALERRLAISPLITGIIVAVFGGLTLWLNDEAFIKLKPTIINLLLASILLVGRFGFGRGLLKPLLGMALELTDEGWKKLSARWGFFFIGLALVNEYVRRQYSTDFWVDFKVFGMLSLTLAFTLCQIPLMKRYAPKAP